MRDGLIPRVQGPSHQVKEENLNMNSRQYSLHLKDKLSEKVNYECKVLYNSIDTYIIMC